MSVKFYRSHRYIVNVRYRQYASIRASLIVSIQNSFIDLKYEFHKKMYKEDALTLPVRTSCLCDIKHKKTHLQEPRKLDCKDLPVV